MTSEPYLEDAIGEAVYVKNPLNEHLQTIVVLHEQKHLTYRAIANWFVSRGLTVDHSMVYRAYQAATRPKISTGVKEPALVVSTKGSKQRNKKQNAKTKS